MKEVTSSMLVGVLLLFRTLSWAQVPSGVKWELVKEGNGIKVYTAPASNSGRKYIKVTAALTGSLSRVQAVFRDVARQKEWVYGTKQAYLIQKADDSHLLYYNETALPWPASNRDIPIRMALAEDPTRHTLTITQEGDPGAAPSYKGIVRVPHFKGNWIFRESNKGQLQVEYYLDIDPGGSLPNWVVNLFIAKGPYETIVKLRELVSQ
jgi:hypothetical protein